MPNCNSAVPDHAAAAASAAVPDHAAAAASAAVADHAAATASAAASAAVPDHAAATASAAVPDNASAVSDHFTFNFPDQGEVDFTFSPNDFVRIGGAGAYDDSTSPIEVEMTSVILSVPGTEHALPTSVLDHVVTALLDDLLV
jgi:hypothetical protein